MKRIFLFSLSLLSVITVMAQTVTGDRIIARQGLYLQKSWIDSVQKDTAFTDKDRAIPTSEAVRKFVEGRTSSSIKNQYATKQTASAWIDSIKAQKALISDSSGKFTTTISNGKVVISRALSDADTSSRTVSKTGYDWNNYGPILGVYTPWSRGSYDLYGGSVFQASGAYNVDTFYNARWGGNNYVFYLANVHDFAAHYRFKGYSSYPTYSFSIDDWRSKPFSLYTSYGKQAGSSGNFKAAFGSRGLINMFNYLDFNNAGGGNRYTGDVSFYYAGGQINRADTFDNFKFYNYFLDGGSTKTTGTGARSFIGYFAPNMTAWNTADRYWAFQQVGASDLNFFNGQVMIGDSNLVNAGSNKLYVLGSTKHDGNIVQTSGRTMIAGATDDGVTALQVNGDILTTKLFKTSPTLGKNTIILNDYGRGMAYMSFDLGNGGPTYSGRLDLQPESSGGVLMQNYNGNLRLNTWAGGDIELWTNQAANKVTLRTSRVSLTGVLNLPSSTAPTSSSDSSGNEGDLKRDASGNLYLKTATGWLKFTGSTF